jgi:hypothetical protein
MNERIEKLYTQALEYADSKVPPERRYNDIYYAIVSGKHAELIVEQCFRIALIEGKGYLNPVKLRNAMKQHFGVEE